MKEKFIESFCYKHSPGFNENCATCYWAKEENYNHLVERYNRERCGGNIPQGGMGYYGAKPVAQSNGTDFDRWMQLASAQQQSANQYLAQQGIVPQLSNVANTNHLASHSGQQWSVSDVIAHAWDIGAPPPTTLSLSVDLPLGKSPVYYDRKLLLLTMKE